LKGVFMSHENRNAQADLSIHPSVSNAEQPLQRELDRERWHDTKPIRQKTREGFPRPYSFDAPLEREGQLSGPLLNRRSWFL
jgi:hypothetical protein